MLAGAFFLWYGGLALLFAPLLVLPIWPRRAFRAVIRAFYRIFVVLARWTGLFKVYADEETRRRLAGLRGAIVVMNHVSLIDIVVIVASLPDATAIAKAAVMRNPFLAIVAKRMFIVNDGDAAAVLAQAAEALGKGVNVVVFPQGTRGGGTFHRGAAHLALSSRRPLLPVRIDYDPPVLAKGQPWWDVGRRVIRIRLAARPAISPSGPDSRANARALTERIVRAFGEASGGARRW